MNHTNLWSGLNTRVVGRNIVWYPVTGSTNDNAKFLARAGVPDGTVVIADEQRAGRGRRGRSWLAPAGSSILASVILRPQFTLPAPYYLVVACSLAVTIALRDLYGIPALVKWPNDVVVGGKKLCGILSEVVGTGRDAAVIVGFGINVNFDPSQMPEIADIATGVSLEYGRKVDRETLLAAVLQNMNDNYSLLQASKSGGLFREWSSHLAYVGSELYIYTGGECRYGRFEGVDDCGLAIVRWDNGGLSRLTEAELSLTQLYIL